MEIRTLKIGKRVWQLVNESWSNSNGWGHKTNVIRNGFDFGETKTKYLNRTWESYTYQSNMFKAVNNIKEDELNRFIESYKYKNNVDRFKKGEKEQVIKDFEKTEIARDLNKLYKAIETRQFS